MTYDEACHYLFASFQLLEINNKNTKIIEKHVMILIGNSHIGLKLVFADKFGNFLHVR